MGEMISGASLQHISLLNCNQIVSYPMISTPALAPGKLCEILFNLVSKLAAFFYTTALQMFHNHPGIPNHTSSLDLLFITG